MKQLAVEFGTEEIPARFLNGLDCAIKENLTQIFEKHHIEFEGLKIYYTPRRIIFTCNVSEKTNPIREDIKGPPYEIAFKNNKPTQAAIGFVKKHAAQIDDIWVGEVNGKKYIYITKTEPPQDVRNVIGFVIKELINSLRFQKSMFWNAHSGPFIRPVRWLLALLENEVINLEIFGVKASNLTYGHRLLTTKPIIVSHAGELIKKLRENFVEPDYLLRRDIIVKELKKYNVEPDEELINENTYLVEYPWVLNGSFPSEFLDLPPEVIKTVLKHHLKAFAVFQNGQVKNAFIAIINSPPNAKIKAGYEKVAKARLEDAKFYFEKDLEKPIEYFVEKTKQITYLESVGTIYEKSLRLIKIGKELSKKLIPEETKKVEETCKILKFDLATNMVYEFPELQGVIARVYAIKKGYPKEIAYALEEHYNSKTKNKIAQIAGIADRLDHICSAMYAGAQITGSGDPLGLRKAAIEMLEIILDNQLELNLLPLIELNVRLLRGPSKIIEHILNFITQRLKRILINQYKLNPFAVESALHAKSQHRDNPFDVLLRAKELDHFIKTPDFERNIFAIKRILNIVEFKGTPDPARFVDEHEKELYTNYLKIKENFETFCKKKDYKKALSELFSLKSYIDNFFDNVLVNVENKEVRLNRHRLLSQIAETFSTFADFSVFQV